jgi:uncharacterized protein YbbK (DUF523 family)
VTFSTATCCSAELSGAYRVVGVRSIAVVSGTPDADPAAAPPVLVSACLLGERCTYDGRDNADDALVHALEGRTVVAVCPERDGGLPTPRPRCEVEGGDGAAVLAGEARVVDDAGVDRSDAYVRGAHDAVAAARAAGATVAVLAPRSPSCGCAGIYDGTHTRTFRNDGTGVAAAALAAAGVRCVAADDAAAVAEALTSGRCAPGS